MEKREEDGLRHVTFRHSIHPSSIFRHIHRVPEGKRWMMIRRSEGEAAAYLAHGNAWVLGTRWTCWIWRRADCNRENSCHSQCLQSNQRAEREFSLDTSVSSWSQMLAYRLAHMPSSDGVKLASQHFSILFYFFFYAVWFLLHRKRILTEFGDSVCVLQVRLYNKDALTIAM